MVRRMTEPWALTATDALAAMRAKELSPVERLPAGSSADVGGGLLGSACTDGGAEEVMAAAVASAEGYARGEDVRPLEGLPVGMKEEVPVEGWRMRYGSLVVDEIATETAPIAERII